MHNTQRKLYSKQKRPRVRVGIVLFAVLVFLSVFYKLMQPVLTMTAEPVCGMEEHTHEQACYTDTLTCDLSQDETHTHGQDCYADVLTCALAEHTHEHACYPAGESEADGAQQNADDPQNAENTNSDSDNAVEASEGTQADAQTLRVTFAVGEAAYTCDPDTQDTHLYAYEPIEGGALSYELEDEQAQVSEDNSDEISEEISEELSENISEEYGTKEHFLVRGTGVICTYDLPRDTSLAQNELAFPALFVQNDEDGNGTSYDTTPLWIDENGTVFTQDSVFTDDTTLYLALQEQEQGGMMMAMGAGELLGAPLLLGATPAPVSVSQDGMTMTIRAGSTLVSISDFVIGGKDYSLYNWVDAQSAPVTLTDYLNTTIPADIVLTTSGDLTGLYERPNVRVNFYAFIDDERCKVGTQFVTAYRTVPVHGNDERYYISDALLESVYRKFGFEADMLQMSTYYFPHVNEERHDQLWLWADTPVMQANGHCFSAITKGAFAVDVYYLPNNQATINGGNYRNYMPTNMFYSVTVTDASHFVYDTQRKEYWRSGATASATVSTHANVTWRCTSNDGTLTVAGTLNGDGTQTFTIPAIDRAYTVTTTPQGKKMVMYDVNLPQVPMDPEYQSPKVGEEAIHVVAVDETDEYPLLAPTLTSYPYYVGKYLGNATFLGWAVNGNTANLVQPHEQIDVSEYDGDLIEITAQWSTKVGGTSDRHGPMVNFFVYLGTVPEGTTSISGQTGTNMFTDSVYTYDCGVNGDTIIEQGLYEGPDSASEYFIFGGSHLEDLEATHNEIVSNLSQGYTRTGRDGNDYTFHIEFPSDEYVLRNIRALVRNGRKKIFVNGVEVGEADLTAENFTIRWNVFKWSGGNGGDGGHIDGYLVAKTGVLRVVKNFVGDPSVIDYVKNNGYQISVSPVAGQNPVHTGAVLTIDNAIPSNDQMTYVWEVPVDVHYQYSVQEENYLYTGENAENYASTSVYRLHDEVAHSEETPWQPYNASTQIVGDVDAAPDGGRTMTIEFGNVYRQRNDVILHTISGNTNNPIGHVSFTVSKQGDPNFKLYSTRTATHYNTYSETPPYEGAVPIAGNRITGDVVGQSYLNLTGGTYFFDEEVPAGYTNPGRITMVVEDHADSDHQGMGITELSAVNDNVDGKDYTQIQSPSLGFVMHYGYEKPLHVEKRWEGDNKPVTIQLYENGVSMGAAYSMVLDGTVDENETEPWHGTFQNIPVYLDGEPAQYSIREERIGTFLYSNEYVGGYQYYEVLYDALSYRDQNDQPVTDPLTAEHIHLGVWNRRADFQIRFNKTDEEGVPVRNAGFLAFLAEEGDTQVWWNDATHTLMVDHVARSPVASGVSDASGVVSMGTLSAGRYYLVENIVPPAYDEAYATGVIYAVELDSDMNYHIKRTNDSGATWNLVPNDTLINHRAVPLVTVKKTDGEGSFLPHATFRVQEFRGGAWHDLPNEMVGEHSAFTVASADGHPLDALPVGRYRLIEISPPNGYYALTEPIEFELTADDVVYQGNDTDVAFAFAEGNGVFTVTNHSAVVLPKTGAAGKLPYLLGGFALMAISFLALDASRRNKEGVVKAAFQRGCKQRR